MSPLPYDALGTDRVRVEASGAVVRVVFDSPRTLNAVDARMLSAAAAAVETAGDDPVVRVIVLTGTGRAFCAGADLNGDDPVRDGGANSATVDALSRLTSAVVAAPKPVVCALNGLAAGAGVSIALACDLVVANESAYLLMAFTKVGLMPDGGATALVTASLGRSRALRLMLLGERLDIAEALAAGLVASVSPAGTFTDDVDALVDQLAAGPTMAYAKTKQAVNAAALPDLAGALERERAGQLALILSRDFAEGAEAFRDKRSPRFTGEPA